MRVRSRVIVSIQFRVSRTLKLLDSTMLKRLLLAILAIVASAFAAQADVSATFRSGAVAEYDDPNANLNDSAVTFFDLGIASAVMSQPFDAWGDSTGTQGNDTDVNLRISFSDQSFVDVAGSLNWVKNEQGGGIQYFGINFGASGPNDLYRLTDGKLKTYILPPPGYEALLDGLVPNDTDGSANFGENELTELATALQSAFPSSQNAPPVFAEHADHDGSFAEGAYSFSYSEGQAADGELGRVAATGPDEDVMTFAIAAGNDDGWFAIDPATGAITLTAEGAAAATNDFEGTPNVWTQTFTASDGTTATPVTVTLTETDVALPGQAVANLNDADGDGVADDVESDTADRDGDSIPDRQDYDPQGYFYCRADGRIVAGGLVSVSGPGNVNMVKDGTASGEYQWFVDAPAPMS